MVSHGNQKNKADNVLLVENMKHNLLSANHICGQGHTFTYDLEKWKINDKDTGSLVANTTRTSNNVYILDEKEAKFSLGKIDESLV